MSSLKAKYGGALRISLIFLVISSLYIIFSDYVIIQVLGDSMQLDDLNRLQSYKGLAYVLLTSILLFLLIQREINVIRSYVKKLEHQQTVLKRVTTEKNEVARKFYTLFMLNPTPIVITKFTDGKILEVNKSFLQLFGYSKKELIGAKADAFSIWRDPEDRKEMQTALKSKQTLREFEAKAVRKDGKLIDTLSYLQAFDLKGEKAIIGIILDVTEKKQNERELRKSKALLEKTLNTLDEAVIFVNPENRKIQLANNVVKHVFGYTPDELVGRDTKILHIDTEHFEKFGEIGNPILEKKGVFHTKFQMKHKNGKIIETENNVTAIYEKDGWRSGVVSVVRDITQQKKAEKKLEEYHDSLKQLTMELSLTEEKQRKHIAANIHDHLSQLLVIAKIRISDLQKRITTKEDQKNLSVINDYIAEALEKSRKITYDLSPPVLYEMGLVETMYWLAEKFKEEYSIEVTFTTDIKEISLSEPKLILTYRIINELVTNALKHAKPDSVEISFTRRNNNLEIKVRDNGHGFVDDGTTSTQFKKDGFGLFTVRERINNLGGSFNIESDPGSGTDVTVVIPLLKEK